MTWESIYNFFGLKDFIYFISSPQLQDMLFPVKIIFIFCAVFFLIFVIYLMLNSSWLQYKFLEETSEFFHWQAYGEREATKQWDRIKKRIESGAESDYKLAIIDADDLLVDALDKRGYEGEDFKEVVAKAGKIISPVSSDVLSAHEIRNSIVYNSDFKISADEAKKVLAIYESAVKNIGI